MAQDSFERSREALKRLINKGELAQIAASAYMYRELLHQPMPNTMCTHMSEAELDNMIREARTKVRAELDVMDQENRKASDGDDEEAA